MQLDPTRYRLKLLTPVRLAPYLTATGGHTKNALSLYHWNIEFSAAIYEALHLAEIALRNAMDTQLRQWAAAQPDGSQEWLFDTPHLLRRLLDDDLNRAHDKAKRACGDRASCHDDVVAQLTFGSWRYLMGFANKDAGRDLLWRECLATAFPGVGVSGRDDLVGSAARLLRLRNRVAHLEPLLKEEHKDVVRDLRRVMSAISPSADTWLTSRQKVTHVGNARPHVTP